ncbi:aminopeptidase P family N-terminal domain-containing protein, partial [Bacillus vallismortis]|nr:aminopeptidase P family N-terminal domain-containing protein [Bacillus vallismortis]
ARNAGWNHEIIGYADHENPWELIEKALKKRHIGIHTLAVDKDSISLSRGEQLKHSVGGAQCVSVEETLNQFRLIKDEQEIRLLQVAAKL